MQKKGFFRLLTVAAVLIFVISACCLTVLGYEPDTIQPLTETTTSSEGETSPPSSESPVTTPEPPETSSSEGEESSSTSSSQGGDTSSESSVSSDVEEPDESGNSGNSGDNTGGNTGNTGGGTGGGYDSSDDEPTYEEPSYAPDYGNSVSEPTVSVPAGSNFNDDDNSDLVDDGSVVSGLPAGEASDSSEESSSESEESSQPEASGNGGSSVLLIAGIVLIVLGVGGLGTVVYLQFIRPKMKAKKAEADSSPFVEDDIDGYNVTPEQPQVDTKADTMEIDINSYDAGKDDEIK